MARTLEQERAALIEDERKLAERRQRLAEKEREAAILAVDKSGLLKVESKRLSSLMTRIRSLGIEEVEKRLTT